MLTKQQIENGLKNGLWFVRDRNFKYPMTSNDVWGREVRRLTSNTQNNGVIEYNEDIHMLKKWLITLEYEIKSETDIFTALQTLKAEVIKYETEKVKEYDDKKCTCYQLDDWNYYGGENGIIVREVNGKEDTYLIVLVKYAIILEDLENSNDNND